MNVKQVILVTVIACAVAGAAFGQSFAQNFESDAVGTPAGWNGGIRWFDPTPGAVTAVTASDAASDPNSLSITGTSGTGIFVWRSYEGLTSDGVQPVTVRFDMKVNNYNQNVAISPFAYNSSVWGGDPGTAGSYGWPVNTNLQDDGTFTYVAETGATVLLDPAVTGDLHGQWLRWSGTLNPVARTADVTVTILTGPAAGTSGSITGGLFQYGLGVDYYGPAMNDLRGLVIFNAAPEFGGEILIDNLLVTVPEPAGLSLLALGALGLLRRRR